MANERSNTTRIVMMSSTLMKLYEVQGLNDGPEYQPITFCHPQECLEMLIETGPKEPAAEEPMTMPRAQRIEKQWGELELRLSFFTDGYKWQ